MATRAEIANRFSSHSSQTLTVKGRYKLPKIQLEILIPRILPGDLYLPQLNVHLDSVPGWSVSDVRTLHQMIGVLLSPGSKQASTPSQKRYCLPKKMRVNAGLIDENKIPWLS